MKAIIWTEEMVRTLKDTYPVESTGFTADLLGISVNAVKKKASEIGLVKFKKSKWLERAEYIRQHFHDKSFATLAKDLGIALISVRRIAASIGLKRSETERFAMISKARTELISRERRRMVFGFDPISHIKVVTNRQRIHLRAKMKAKGYIVAEERNVMYYPSDLKRCVEREKNGIGLGLRFMPLPVETELLTAVI